MDQQLRDNKYYAIADVYTDSDPQFQSWVRENMQNKDHMEQMEQILATNAHTKWRDETNADYTKKSLKAVSLTKLISRAALTGNAALT
jgi:hypothetical protein